MSLRSADRRFGGPTSRFATLALAAMLLACTPIEAYRSVRGLDKNDPDPKTAPYSESLAKGLDQPYPNLASVPPPPTIASTVAERERLAAALTTERGSVEAPDAQGKPGSPTAGPVPPMPPLPSAVEAPVAPPEAPAAQPTTRVTRKMDEPPAPGPIEASGQTPTIAALPNAEAMHPPPGRAGLPSAPAPIPPQAALPPASLGSAQPQAAPAQPVLPEARPSPAAARPPPKLPPTGTMVLALDLPIGSTGLPADDRARLEPIAAMYKAKPGGVRIVAYAAAATGSAEQLNSFRTALDRAQAVAKALTNAGVPADKIQTEASPAEAASPAGRVEVRLLP
jgi:outer membrane protein OmpA-like peptidoglycan-associated protein